MSVGSTEFVGRTLLAGNPLLSKLGRLFTGAGFDLYLVGGSVRDALLGNEPDDLDFTTSARPDEILQLVDPVADAVWTVGREFGTIAAQVDGLKVEITTFRADAYDTGSRKPVVRFGDAVEEDLARRDFTINAVAVSLPDGLVVDPFGGAGDLAAGRLRTPLAPDVAFSEDPLRMLRAARFVAKLGAEPTGRVVKSMRRMRDRLEIVSTERVEQELSKLLLTGDPVPGLRLLVDTGLADVFLPELPGLRAAKDEHRRHKDVYEHSLTVLRQAIDLERSRGHEPDLVNRLAALLHDIGKPATRRFERGGKVTFHGHDLVGAKMVRKRLKALRYPTEVVAAVSDLVRLHLRFHGYGESGWSDAAVRRYVRDAGDQLERLHMLTRADCTTRNQKKAARLSRIYDDLEDRIAELRDREELDAMRPDLDGNQIMEILGIPPGKEVGRAYRFLLELRVERGPLGAEQARKQLLEWHASVGV